jgi:hypothetical protein
MRSEYVRMCQALQVDSLSDYFAQNIDSNYAIATYRLGLNHMRGQERFSHDLGKAEIYLKHAARCGVADACMQLRKIAAQEAAESVGEAASAEVVEEGGVLRDSKSPAEVAEFAMAVDRVAMGAVGGAAAVMAPVALRPEAAGGGAGEVSVLAGGSADLAGVVSGAKQQGELGSVDESAAFAPLSVGCAEVEGLTRARNGEVGGSGLGPSPVSVDDDEVFSGQCVALAGGSAMGAVADAGASVKQGCEPPLAKRAKTPPPSSPPPISGGASDSLGRA